MDRILGCTVGQSWDLPVGKARGERWALTATLQEHDENDSTFCRSRVQQLTVVLPSQELTFLTDVMQAVMARMMLQNTCAGSKQ